MSTYRIDTFLKTGEIYIDPDIQNRDRNPFTIQHAKTLFDCFREESFELNGVVRSLYIYDGREDLPRESYAKGFLYAERVDELEEYASNHNGDLPDHVGNIRLECGGGPARPGVLVRTTPAAADSLRNAAAKESWELKVEKDSQDKVTWHCFYCDGRISEEALSNWTCPVCKYNNDLPIDYAHCSRCDFSASYFTCPHCNRDFDIRLFSFNCYPTGGTPKQRIGAFVISCSDNLRSLVENFSDETHRRLSGVEIDLPMPIKRVHLEGYHKVQNSQEWFHLSLWTSDDETRPAVLMSVNYPGISYGDKKGLEQATIAYLHLYSNPVPPDALTLITEVGATRSINDPKVRDAIRQLSSE